MKNYINGFKNRRIEVLHFGSNNSDDVFIHFPGNGYGPNHPFFYYLIQFLDSIKIDQIFFNYKWSEQEEIFKLSQDDGLSILKSEIVEAINFIETRLFNKRLHIVGKSLGTIALELIHENEFTQEILDNLQENVYLTIDVDFFDPAVMPATGTPTTGTPATAAVCS